MPENCFCHFNGFQVKDAVARRAIGEITERVGKIEKDTKTARFFFPCLDKGGYSGSSAIMTAGDKCVLLDCGPAVNWEPIREYYSDLYNRGVFSNIDYIVISHFHWDHVENLGAILDLFPHDGVQIFVPMNHAGYLAISDETTEEEIAKIEASRSGALEALTSRNLQYVEVPGETTVTICDGFCNMVLFNSSYEDYTYYRENLSVYNNFSMCALFKIGSVYSLFPGDIQRDAQIRILETRELPRLFLYAVHHHGIQNDDVPEYLDMIRPEHAVISTSHNRMIASADASMAANYATENLYSCGYDSFEFVAQQTGGSIVSGKEIHQSGWLYSYVDLYVNNEYAGNVHDGTEEHPFINPNEVNMFLNNNRNTMYKIHIKATGTEYPLMWLRNCNKQIFVEGYSEDGDTLPRVAGLYIAGCADVEIENVHFTNGRKTEGTNAVVFVQSSNVVLNGCDIESPDPETYRGVLAGYWAEIYITGCKILNCEYGISAYRYAAVVSNSIDFEKCDSAYYLNTMALTIRGEDSVTDCDEYIRGTTGSGAQVKLTTRKADSNIENLVALNTTSVISDPFYYSGHGYCIAIGKEIHKLATESIAAAAAE